MNYFIKNIHINELFHLKDLDIPIADEKYPHLIITGKNGSGKTVLLNAVADFIEIIKRDNSLFFLQYEQWLNNAKQSVKRARTEQQRAEAELQLSQNQNLYNQLYGKVNIEFDNVAKIIKDFQKGDFILAMYQVYRKPAMKEPKNPTKPEINKNGSIKDAATSQFLNFMSDLKIQEALARNEKQYDDADVINEWFVDFEKLS